MSSASPTQFALTRILLGTYLFIHFAELLPYGSELFSRSGIYPRPSDFPNAGLFPNLLVWLDGPAFVAGFLLILAALSLAFGLGFHRQPAAILLWYGFTCLALRNPLIANPGLPYVGLTLLLSTLVPSGEGLSIDGVLARREWRLPPAVPKVIFWALVLGYSYSGWMKWQSPSWQNGDVFLLMLDNPMARGEAAAVLSPPDWLLRLMGWSVLALELLAAPLSLIGRRMRFVVWLAFVGMHLGIMVTIDFVDLTMGLIVAHALAFNRNWLPPTKRSGSRTLFFDGQCGRSRSWARWVLLEDSEAAINFAPLQGATAADILSPDALESGPGSIFYWDSSAQSATRPLDRSDAVIALLDDLGGIFRLARVFRWVPRTWRDFLYDLVSKHCLRTDQCSLSGPEWKGRLMP